MPEEDINEQLNEAILCNNPKRVQRCLENSANPNYKTGTNDAPLVDAAHTPRKHKIVALLLRYGAQVDMVIKDQELFVSPLHWAASTVTIESHEALDHMLTHDKNKAFRYLKDGHGQTPYDYIRDKALKAHYDDLLAAEIEATPPANTSSWPTSFFRLFQTCADPAKEKSSNAIELSSISSKPG